MMKEGKEKYFKGYFLKDNMKEVFKGYTIFFFVLAGFSGLIKFGFKEEFIKISNTLFFKTEAGFYFFLIFGIITLIFFFISKETKKVNKNKKRK